MNQIKLFLLLFLITFSYSDTIVVDENTQYQEILSKSEIYIDHSRKLSIDDVVSGKVEFEKNDKDALGFGYSPDLDVWIKVSLKNHTNRTIEKVIEYDNPITTNVDFFDMSNNIQLKEGSFNTQDSRKTLTPIYKIKLTPFETRTYYIKVSSYITTLIVKLKLWDDNKFYKKEIIHQVILALFFGALIVLALYNIFIYFITKSISYLFYVLYVLGIVFHHLMYVGFANIYLFNDNQMLYITNYAVLLATFPILALALFTKYFLVLKQYPIMNKILNIFLLIVSLSIVFFILTDEFNNYRNLLPLFLFIYLFFVTIVATYKKNGQAYFLLFGWSTIVLAIAFMYLSSRGLFNIYEYYPYVIETAFILEAVIFSIALAYKIKQLQRERNAINDKLLLQEKQEAERLKVQVEEKTKDLKNALDEKSLLLKEVHHRVKNNMQLILSLIELQSDDIEDKKLKSVFTTVQSRIYAMSELHELLYRDDVNILKIDAYEYFDKIIDELRQSYSIEYIDIKFDIQAKVEVTQAIYCGLILNELVTNSMKYAFRENAGYILISLKMIDGKYIFHVEDNGMGFDRKHKDGSLGLLLVDTLVKNQLRGELKLDTKDGVKVDIVWREDDKQD